MELGLHIESNSSWIAGSLYSQTIASSLAQVPRSERPEISLLYPFGSESSSATFLQHDIHAKLPYSYRDNHPLLHKLRAIKRTLIQRQSIPWSLERQVLRNRIDLIFPCQESLGPAFPIPWIGWIPDFQHKRFPGFFDNQVRSYRDSRYQQLIHESSHCIVSSEDAKNDLLTHYDADPEKVSTYKFCTFAEDSWFDGNPAETASRLGLPEKFLIFPSQFWKHKNHLKLFQSIRRVKEAGLSDIKLVLTGNRHDYRFPEYGQKLTSCLKAPDLKDTIIHAGLLPRAEQIQLIRQAAAVIQPSYFEGWSMLVEDARALGKHILLSDIPVHREQAYNNSTYFNPHSTSEITQAIQKTWPTLTAGLSLASETEARAQNKKRAYKNGTALIEMFNRVNSN